MNIENQKYVIGKSDKGDRIICHAIFSNFVVLSIQYFVLLNFSLLNTALGAKVQLASKVIILVFFLRALPIVLKRRGKTVIIAYLIAGIVYMWNIVFFSQNTVYLNDYVMNFFVLCIPTFLYVYSVKDLTIFKKMMIKSGYIIIGTSGGLGVLVFLGKASIGMYSMTLSYYLLFPAIVFFNEYFNQRNIINLILSTVAVFLILILGARGPLLALMSFFILLFFYNSKKKNYLYYIYKLLIILSVILLIIFFKDIVQILYTTLLVYGIDSRTLYLLTLDNVHMSGREEIYANLFEFISASPIWGYGLAGDIYLLDGYGFAHNLVIEVFINFGVFLGSGLILIILALFYQALKSSQKLNVELSAMFFSLGFVHLFVSSSYLIDFKFWIFLGLIMNIYSKRIRREVTN